MRPSKYLPDVKALLLFWLLCGSQVLAAQTPENLLASARAKVAARDLDGARPLLVTAAESARGGTPAIRAEALLLLGLIHYYQGSDSLARVAFAGALRLRPEARIPTVQESDPDVTRLLEQERCRLAAFERGFGGTCMVTGLTVLPEILEMPALMYPPDLREKGIQGRVWVTVTVDTAGVPVAGSVAIAESPDSGFNAIALEAVQGARFRPGAIGDRVVRTELQVPIDFRIGTETPDSAPALASSERAVACLPDCPAGVTKPAMLSLLDFRNGALRLFSAGELDGAVTVEAVVRVDGRLDAASMRMTAQGVPVETGNSVMEAVRKVRFEPAHRDGRAVPARIRVRVSIVTTGGVAPRIETRVL